MTVCAVGSMGNKWQGQDGEQVTLENVDEGTTFHAVDTGAQYVYHNGGWAEDLRLIYASQHV